MLPRDNLTKLLNNDDKEKSLIAREKDTLGKEEERQEWQQTLEQTC